MENYNLYYIKFTKNNHLIDDNFNEKYYDDVHQLYDEFKRDYNEIKSLSEITPDGEISITTNNIEIYNLIDKNNKIKHKIRFII